MSFGVFSIVCLCFVSVLFFLYDFLFLFFFFFFSSRRRHTRFDCDWSSDVCSSDLPTDTWTHLAATYDGAVMRFYTNGVLVGSQAETGPIQTSTLPLTIGGDEIGRASCRERV